MGKRSKFSLENEEVKALLPGLMERLENRDIDAFIARLYEMYPEDEAEDKAYIERTLPILRKKLGLDTPSKVERRRTHIRRLLIILGVIIVVVGLLFFAVFLKRKV